MKNKISHDINICKRCKIDTRRKERVIRITETILFGKYQIISILGTGSSSTVYLAEHLKLHVYRAIKCIPKKHDTITSQCLEATLLKNLKHPGIPLIYDIDEDKQYIYMIEEYIQGESLESFVLHQDKISPELVIRFGIQLCDILEYLHQLMPYPILYQDLKPEHIILCGNQLKLVDFGIASFFTGSNKHSQFYGTKDFAAPEVLTGQEITPLSDMYSLGKVLLYFTDRGHISCSSHLLSILQKACAPDAQDRYETVSLFKIALEKELNSSCPEVLHLCKNIAVYGSKHGVGTTHIAISLVSTLNQHDHTAIYVENNHSDSLRTMIRENHAVKEENGICYYNFFRGIPNYGSGIAIPIPPDCTLVKDCGVYNEDTIELDPENMNIFVMSGSDWDLAYTILAGKKLSQWDNTVFICNYNQKKSAKKLAHLLNRKVYCFPFDTNAFFNTAEKDSFFFTFIPFERRKKSFLHFIKRLLTHMF